MRLKTLTIVFMAIGFGFGATACAQLGPDDQTESDLAALKGGCRWDCPKCVPNKPCSRRACFLICPPGVSQCGDNVCRKGEFCCNASCGICAPEGGFCTEQACAPSTQCQSDSDCTTYSNYCEGCNCEALHVNAPLPLCTGDTYQCLIDPCGTQKAVCNRATKQCELAPNTL